MGMLLLDTRVYGYKRLRSLKIANLDFKTLLRSINSFISRLLQQQICQILQGLIILLVMYLTKNIPSKEEISTLQKVVILKCFIFDDIDQYWDRI